MDTGHSIPPQSTVGRFLRTLVRTRVLERYHAENILPCNQGWTLEGGNPVPEHPAKNPFSPAAGEIRATAFTQGGLGLVEDPTLYEHNPNPPMHA